MIEESIYLRIAKNIIGQCNVGNVDCIVFVNNGSERLKLIDTIAALQYSMGFEGNVRAGVVTLFGKKVNIIVMKKGAVNGMKYGDARIYSLNQ